MVFLGACLAAIILIAAPKPDVYYEWKEKAGAGGFNAPVPNSHGQHEPPSEHGGPPPPPPPPPPPSHGEPEHGSRPADNEGDSAASESNNKPAAHKAPPASHLSEDDFKPHIDDSGNLMLDRLESAETWRNDAMADNRQPLATPERPEMPSAEFFDSMGEYMKQPIVADYAHNSDNIFLMLKEGGDVLWDRIPVHLTTTLTRVKNFAIYADAPGSIAGYEVIDVLENVTDATFHSGEFDKYRKMKYLHDTHSGFGAGDVKIDGGWTLDKYKNVPMLDHAYRTSPDSEWFVFMDGDSYVNFDVLVEFLAQFDGHKPYYFGSPSGWASYTFAHGGSVVVVSKGALDVTLGKDPSLVEKYEKFAPQCCCGDVIVAVMLIEEAGIQLNWAGNHLFQGNPIWDMKFREDYWCEPVISYHHLTGHDIEILWEYERSRGPNRANITYADVYRDFVLPYIDYHRNDWDNRCEGDTYTGESEVTLRDKTTTRPGASVEACQRACDNMFDCLSWRYDKQDSSCCLAGTFKLGRASKDWLEIDNVNDGDTDRAHHGVVSGWNIDRLKRSRAEKTCDIANDPQSQHPDEGWFWRRKEVEAILSHGVN